VAPSKKAPAEVGTLPRLKEVEGGNPRQVILSLIGRQPQCVKRAVCSTLLSHLLHRSRLTKAAIGASGRSPQAASAPGLSMLLCCSLGSAPSRQDQRPSRPILLGFTRDACCRGFLTFNALTDRSGRMDPSRFYTIPSQLRRLRSLPLRESSRTASLSRRAISRKPPCLIS